MERIQFWNMKDLGLEPNLGVNVALSPLQSYLNCLRVSFLFCYPPNRVAARGLRNRIGKSDGIPWLVDTQYAVPMNSMPGTLPTFRNSEVVKTERFLSLLSWW